jgi:outer membrane lipoprotein-sorting protein
LIEFADWNLNPKLNADTFVFKAPANAKQIEFGHYQPEQKK